MIAYAIALLAGAAEAPRPAARPTCVLGRVALDDLLIDMDGQRGGGNPYLDTDPPQPGLFAACPALLRAIPPGVHLADNDARSRAAVHAPVPGHETIPATIYTIGAPVFSTDRRTATVQIQYDCTGLCGGFYVLTYARTANKWRRRGGPRQVWVS